MGTHDDRSRERSHQEVRHGAAAQVGRSLDVVHIAQDLVDILVPAFGDLANVELAEAVLAGNEPPEPLAGGQARWLRVAVASGAGPWPAELIQPGQLIPPLPDSDTVREFQSGGIIVTNRKGVEASVLGSPDLIKAFLPESASSMAAAPLFARGLVLGTVVVWRTERSAPFDPEDVSLLSEIASWVALTVDNARRYTREYRTATALQQRLLPRATTETSAAETAGCYVPAGGGGTEIGGDWFDVLPLPSLRVAMVMGDVIGHGLHATATMGRLRTAVQTLADLELEPDELLTRVDDQVQRVVSETPLGLRDTVGASCLYATYDPVTGQCQLASAGHPPPLLYRHDGTTEILEVEPGPPLGVGGMPFEVTTVELEPESVIAFYTDGLTQQGHRDPDVGTQQLADELTARLEDRNHHSLRSVGDAVIGTATRNSPRDDMTLLLARVHRIPEGSTAAWSFEANPASISEARKAVRRQLALWNLDQLCFTTEMIVSELLTNAVRYGGAPIALRLLHNDTVLVCEVSDGKNTAPRLRRARSTDEGGRGLFLVAQLSRRWGSRYGRWGKTIWAEQHLAATDDQPALML